jgi:hypothetical protein
MFQGDNKQCRVSTYESIMKRIFWMGVLALNFLAKADAQTIFYFTSSPTSYTGGGQTFYATPASGYTISVSDTWRIECSCYGPDFNPDWTVLLEGANEAPLTIGEYTNTVGPGVDSSLPSLYFFGQGRASADPTGCFDILALTLDTNGAIVSFAADFVQYDDGNTAEWNAGSIRFNSSIPIPEPSLLGPVAIFCFSCLVRRRSAMKPSVSLSAPC